jgi:hypothetical protein
LNIYFPLYEVCPNSAEGIKKQKNRRALKSDLIEIIVYKTTLKQNNSIFLDKT